MSIEPGLYYAVMIVAGMMIVALLIVTLVLSSRLRSIGTGGSPLERIAGRLDMLERISGNLDELSRLFLVPHARGGLAETLLEELLHTWLPNRSYELQYRFSNGTRADAVIRIGEFLVAVDAKFPLEQARPMLSGDDAASQGTVRRVFVKHIEDIATKYIRPAEGTLEFALMYLPSEALYYRAFVDTDGTLMAEAVHRGVVPVGPAALFLYLQTVAFGLKGLGIGVDARLRSEITNQLVRDFTDLAKSIDTTTTHLRNAERNSVELVSITRRFGSLLDRLASGDLESRRPK